MWIPPPWNDNNCIIVIAAQAPLSWQCHNARVQHQRSGESIHYYRAWKTYWISSLYWIVIKNSVSLMTFIRSAWSDKFIHYPFPFLVLAEGHGEGWRADTYRWAHLLLSSSNPAHSISNKQNSSKRIVREIWACSSETSPYSACEQQSCFLGRGGRNENYDIW